MEKNQKKYVESLLKNYQIKETTKIDQLKSLDKLVKKPAKIFAYIFGSIGSLVLGMGMCAAMNTLPEVMLNMWSKEILMVFGIIIGLIGIVMVSVNYFLYQKILKIRKNKYREQIISLSDELLNE